jgi:hypothetical protein
MMGSEEHLVLELRDGSRTLMKAAGFSATALMTSVRVLLGQGKPLLHGLDLHGLGFCVTDRNASEYATLCAEESCNTELTTKADENESQKGQVPAASFIVSLRDGMNRPPIASPLLLVGRDAIETWHGSDDEYREVSMCEVMVCNLKDRQTLPNHSSQTWRQVQAATSAKRCKILMGKDLHREFE